MISSMEYIRYIAAEVKNTTGKDAEIFNSTGCLLASTLAEPSERLDVLSAFPEDGRHSVLSENMGGPAESYALTARVVCSGKKGCFLTLYGDSAKDLMTVHNTACKLVEVLLRQEMNNHMTMSSKKDKSFFFEGLVFGTYAEETVKFMAAALHVNIAASFCVAVMRIYPYNNFGEYDQGRRQVAAPMVLEELEQYNDRHANTAVLSLHDEIILVSGDMRPAQVKAVLRPVADKVRSSLMIDINCGISLAVPDYHRVNSAYRNARALCAIAERDSENNVAMQNEQMAALALEFIPKNIKREYVEVIFKNSTDKDISDWFEIIQVLNKHNGSIGRSAEELFMHKNTLQYRLNRIREKTGYDPRHSGDVLSLMMAFLMRRSLQEGPSGGQEEDRR